MSRHERATRAPAVSAKALVEAAKAVGHPARLRILAMLQGRSMCVCQMTAVLELAPSTVSGHLNDLRRSGLVVEDRRGKLVYYTLDAGSPFHDLVRRCLALVHADGRVAADRALIDRVRSVPIEVITRAGFRLAPLASRAASRPARKTSPGVRPRRRGSSPRSGA